MVENTRMNMGLKEYTVETRYNGFEGTREFWLLNPNVVKSNY